MFKKYLNGLNRKVLTQGEKGTCSNWAWFNQLLWRGDLGELDHAWLIKKGETWEDDGKVGTEIGRFGRFLDDVLNMGALVKWTDYDATVRKNVLSPNQICKALTTYEQPICVTIYTDSIFGDGTLEQGISSDRIQLPRTNALWNGATIRAYKTRGIHSLCIVAIDESKIIGNDKGGVMVFDSAGKTFGSKKTTKYWISFKVLYQKIARKLNNHTAGFYRLHPLGYQLVRHLKEEKDTSDNIYMSDYMKFGKRKIKEYQALLRKIGKKLREHLKL